ncbi:DesA Fatty acid desaturase [Mycobacteriaceae bacterium]
MTTMEYTPTDILDPTAHLSAADIADLGVELDAIRADVVASRGERDAAYIRKVIDAQRKLELSSRAILLFSLFPPAWLAGTVGLSISKIIENMEIGHNVMHGQWDWMRDPKIHSTSWEWDNASPADMWKHSHNQVHHNYTNVIGKDNDLGYGIMRVDEDQRWKPLYLVQPLSNAINACFFQYGIAAYDLEIGKFLKGRVDKADFRARGKKVLAKIGRHATRDYVLHPLLSGPSALTTLTANLTANLVRNLWTHSVIMCGHFPEGVQTFAKTSIEGETRGEWYLRQMLGSANISGGPALHFMTGNLSFQIEHHLFPDLPSNRYQEIAPKVEALFERYGLTYTSGSLPKQVGSAWKKIIRLSLPNDFLNRAARRQTVPGR